MKNFNIVIVYDKDEKNILMCKRLFDPYKGKYNLLGGKIEKDENFLESMYRELKEESNITKDDIELVHFMDFYYPLEDIKLNAFTGVIKNDVTLIDEKHPLNWISIKEDFFDMDKFAGEGNIRHMIEIVKMYKKEGLI